MVGRIVSGGTRGVPGQGLNVSGIDCLIAATAIAGGHELFAVEGDFGAIARHSPLSLFRESGVA